MHCSLSSACQSQEFPLSQLVVCVHDTCSDDTSGAVLYSYEHTQHLRCGVWADYYLWWLAKMYHLAISITSQWSPSSTIYLHPSLRLMWSPTSKTLFKSIMRNLRTFVSNHPKNALPDPHPRMDGTVMITVDINFISMSVIMCFLIL